MTSTSAVLTRVVRRETHSPRTVAAVIVLILVALAAIYAGVEIALQLLGFEPLLLRPGAAASWLTAAPAASPQVVVAVGVIAVVAGAVLVWLSLSPGRRPKHLLGVSPRPVLVDDGVIASSLAERVRRERDLPRGAVTVAVGHRTADVTARPEAGQLVAKDHVRSVVETELGGYELSPRVRVRVRVLRPADVEEAS